MGVAGAGKTVVGKAFARAIGADFIDGDDYHSPRNKEKMAAGTPLTDEDRADWLRTLAGKLHDAAAEGRGLVLACSALKRVYRDTLRSGGEAQFVFLRGPKPLIAERLAHRTGHYMPPALLDSQVATLEEPTADEAAWVVDVSDTPAEIVASLAERVAGARRG